MNLSLTLMLLISAALHAGLILLAPAVRLSPIFAGQSDRMEVDLVRRAVPIPEALLPKPLPPVPLPKPLDLGRLLPEETAVMRDLSLDMKEPPPAPERGELPPSKPLPAPPAVDVPRPTLAPGSVIPPEDVLAPGGARGEISLPAGEAEESRGLPGALRREAAFPDAGADRRVLEELARENLARPAPKRRRAAVAGPAAERRILFRPPPPKVARLDSTTEIVLKFWVLPDGAVGRVIPVKKANAHLEGLASNNLKRWRFSPLPPGGRADAEQWGEVTFRFVLR